MHVEAITFPKSQEVHPPGRGRGANPIPTCPAVPQPFLRITKTKAAPLLSRGGLGNRESEKAAEELVSPLPPSPLSNNPLP